ncbi:MAG: hypothetical protein M1819_000260 [Sarea resinae]|nr:MAG: hypothetical protein M1819_000260 [Sarea resinae]
MADVYGPTGSTSTASPTSAADCPFCAIANAYTSSTLPSPQTSSSSSSTHSSQPHQHSHNSARPDPNLTTPQTHLILSTPTVLAFLDIAPLSPAHTLVTTRAHHEKLSDLSTPEAMALGAWLPVVSRVIARVTGIKDWNVVQNNGAAAAQIVPHVHFHIVPRPADTVTEIRNKSWTMFGRGQREELDDDEGEELAARLRSGMVEEMDRLRGGAGGGGGGDYGEARRGRDGAGAEEARILQKL